MAEHGWDSSIHVVSALLSILSVFTYIAESYYEPNSNISKNFRLLNFILGIMFGTEWCFWLWLSKNKLRYIISVQSLVDIVTVPPIILNYTNPNIHFWLLRAIRTVRILRVLRIFKVRKLANNEVTRRAMILAVSLFGLMLIFAG